MSFRRVLPLIHRTTASWHLQTSSFRRLPVKFYSTSSSGENDNSHFDYRKAAASILSIAAVGFVGAQFEERKAVKNDITQYIGIEELMKHNTLEDCWVAIQGQVFDVSEFLQMHPGGAQRILKYAGRDATKLFSLMHTEEVLERMLSSIRLMGNLRGEFKEELSEEELQIADNRQRMPSLEKIFNVSDFEYVAKKVLPTTTFFYYATGASDEFSLRENHYAYKRVFFRPKVLTDISQDIDLKTTMMGNEVDIPIYITAFAGSKLAHPLGEYNLQKAAYKSNIMQMVPKQLCFPWDQFMGDVPEDQKHWFQYHFSTVDELDDIEEIVKKISSYKTVKGIFINVDCGELGNREKDSKRRLQFETDEGDDMLSSIANNGKAKYGNVAWKHIDRVRASTDLPIALKGVQRGEDVVLAAEKGISGVILSNHGGRQLDFSRPPLEVLVEARQMLKEKNLQDKIDIYVDGGVRRGSDVIKALCLGAKGVGLGRPFLFAMAGYGEQGVTKMIDIIKEEMVNNMKLLGVDSIKDLNEDLVDTYNLKFRSASVLDDQYKSNYEEMLFPSFKE